MSHQRKGQLSRADLLDALVATEKSTVDYLTKQLGLALQTTPASETPITEPKIPPPATINEESPVSQLPEKTTKPVSGFWSLEKREDTKQQSWLRETINQEPVVWSAQQATNLLLPKHYPLTSPRSLLTRLFHHFKYQHETREIDVEQVVKKLSCVEHMIEFPKKRRRSLGRHLHLIDDRQLHLTPYWRDNSLFTRLIENFLPDYATSRAVLQNGRSLPVSFTQAGKLSNWELPPEGSVVLVFSDLGALAMQHDSLVEIWLNLARKLKRQNCKLIALVPCHPSECDERLKSLFIIEPWEIEQHLTPCTPLQRLVQAEQLLTLLAPAIRLEPSLLRSVRKSLAQHGINMNAAVEAVVWQHPAMQEHSSVAATFSPEARQQWLKRFYTEDSDLRQTVLATMRSWRTQLQQQVWFEEITSLDESSRNLVSQQDLQDAKRYFQQLIRHSDSGSVLTKDVDTQLWLRRLEKRLQPVACNLPELGFVFQEIIAQLHKDDKDYHTNLPINPEKLSPINLPEQTALLYQRNKHVMIASVEVNNEFSEQKPLASIRYKRPLLYIKFDDSAGQTFFFQSDLQESRDVCELVDLETLMIRSDLDSLYFQFMPVVDRPLKLFYSYSHKDKLFLDELEKYLKPLQQQGIIETWHDGKIEGGTNWQQAIDSKLEAADIILLLISADFLASKYLDIEVQRAMQRHEEKSVVVIPVLLSPCDVYSAGIMKLQVLPKNFKPVTTWAHRDDAFIDIVESIRTIANRIRAEILGRLGAEYVKFADTFDGKEMCVEREKITDVLEEETSISTKLKILFLSAAPEDQNNLNVYREYVEIQEGIQKGISKNLVELPIPSEWDVRLDQLLSILMRNKPDIVHFSGSSQKEGILFEDRYGKSNPIGKDLLTDVFRHVIDNTKLVVLNTSYSDDQAEAIAKVVGYAIGMPQIISDSMAIQFSVSFYRNIAFGYSIQNAFNISIKDLRLSEVDADKLPRLYVRNIDADLVFLIERKGEWLFSDDEVWECFVTVLAFSEQIHHIFQTLRNVYLEELVSKLEIERQEHPALVNKESFYRTWLIYQKGSDFIFNEFYSKFPDYEKTIPNALDKIELIENVDITNAAKLCREYIYAMNKELDEYKHYHEIVAYYMKNTLISQLSLQNDVARAILNLVQFSQHLTFDSGSVLHKLITIMEIKTRKHYLGKCNANLVSLNERKGNFLFSNYEVWECYVTVLAFSEQISHIFQTIEIQHLQGLINIIDQIGKKTLLSEKSNFFRLWDNYKVEFHRLFEEDFKAKFYNYKTDIEEIFTILKSIDNTEIQQKIKFFYAYYENIEYLLESYTGDHYVVCKDIVERYPTALDSTDNKQRILLLSVNAQQLTTVSDDLLKELIAIMLEV